ncbi:MAG: transcriptional regulator [bacterium]|nr:MAG: transcriptional regulator [bacterium]
MSRKTSHAKSLQNSELTQAKTAGRKRCPITHQNILEATSELLNEIGFSNLTIEGIAARAGVGKTTIYRHWLNKASLVMDAFLAETAPQFPYPNTSSAITDIREQMKLVVKVLNSSHGNTVATLIGGSQTDAELAEAFRTRFLALRRAESKAIVKKGIEQNEIPSNIDADMLLDTLYSPLYFRLLIKHAPLTETFVDQIMDLVVNGLTPNT